MSIGSVLKEARAKREASLEEVHAKIKIHPRVLQLLEEEKFDRLPSPLFVKSFLKSYADYLGVNGDELVSLYEKDKKEEPQQVLFIRSAEERLKQSRVKPRNMAVIAAVAAGVLLVAAWVVPPTLRAVGQQITRAREGMAAFYKSSSAKKKKTQSASKAAAPAPKVKEEPKKPAVNPAWLHSVELGNFQAIPKKEQLQLEIRAIDTVWLKILTDGKTAFQGLVKKGDKATATANDAIEISTGNPDSMFWSLNGRSIGSPGKGVARKMRVTREGIFNLQPPRAD